MGLSAVARRSLAALHWPTIGLMLPFVLMAIVITIAPVPALAAPRSQRVEIEASQFAFAPGRIQVNQGDTVVITLTASDVVHGFYLEGYGISQRVEPGVEQQITFTADRRGKFRYRCSVSCGPLHPFMIGELIVGPNLPFWRAVGVTVTALIGLFVYLGQEQTGREE